MRGRCGASLSDACARRDGLVASFASIDDEYTAWGAARGASARDDSVAGCGGGERVRRGGLDCDSINRHGAARGGTDFGRRARR